MTNETSPESVRKIFLPVWAEVDVVPKRMDLLVLDVPGSAGWMGFLTDHFVFRQGLPSTTDPGLIWLGHVSVLGKCLIDDRMSPITGLAGKDTDLVGDEVPVDSFRAAEAVVDGQPIEADTLDYRNLTFLLGRDYARHPFVVLQPADQHERWPELKSVEAVND